MRRQALLAAVALALAGAGCASTGRSLVVVTLANDVDVTALNAPIQVYDHFFAGKDGATQHRYVAEVATGDLAKVRARTASLEVVDVPGRSSFYYWFQAPKGVEAVAEKLGARIVYRRSSQEVLVQLNVPLSSVNWPYTIHVVPVDRTTAIPPVRISRHAYDTTFRRHMMPLPPHVSHVSAVQDILDNFDFGACEALVRQLAGTDPIQVNGSPYTVVTRELCGPDIDPLIDWLNTDLTASGLQVTIDTMSYMDPGCPSRRHRQVIATIPGTDLADQLWIVMAHLDAVPGTPGADDNASGVTALLCTAKALAHSRFRRTIQFVAVNAEEVGLRGSREYVADTLAAGTFEVCGGYTMDMVAWDGDQDRKFQVQSNPGDASSAYMRDRLIETVGVYGLNLVPVSVCDSDSTSDHGSFWQQGKPAVLAGEEFFCETPTSACDWVSFCQQEDFNPNYHQPSDRVPTLQMDVLRETTKAMIAVTAFLAEIQ